MSLKVTLLSWLRCCVDSFVDTMCIHNAMTQKNRVAVTSGLMFSKCYFSVHSFLCGLSVAQAV